jgi:hypothetical protein
LEELNLTLSLTLQAFVQEAPLLATLTLLEYHAFFQVVVQVPLA